MENEITAINIVLLFDNSLRNTCIELSQKINAQINSQIVLNSTDILPHMTLYTTRYPRKNLGMVRNRLCELLQHVRPFKIQLTSKKCFADYLFIEPQFSTELQGLHEKIVDELNYLREGAYEKEALKLPGLTKEMRQSLTDYGMWAAKRLYRPHVTIAKFANQDQCKEALKLLPDSIFYTAIIRSVGLVETGMYGTCKKILETFPLLLQGATLFPR